MRNANGWVAPVLVVALAACGASRLAADSGFFRVAGPGESRITAFDQNGWLTWSNEATGGTNIVMRARSLTPPAEWTDWVTVPVTNTVLTAQVMWRMVSLPAGVFAMGNAMDPQEGWIDEVPVHTVSVSALWMDAQEVDLELWQKVALWAADRGYQFSGTATGKGPSHPVVGVSWLDCLKWCNARSELEGLTPCYYTDGTLTAVYTNGEISLGNHCVSWSASGYRLPTEAEWEYAARGGADGRRFSWPDSEAIGHARANYWSYWEGGNPYYAYDESAEEGYHPAYTNGVEPFTSPCGSFSPNGFGLYDFAGNVTEWCWDSYQQDWYTNAAASEADTRGPASGEERAARGGAWNSDAFSLRVSCRISLQPSAISNDRGFRCVRAP